MCIYMMSGDFSYLNTRSTASSDVDGLDFGMVERTKVLPHHCGRTHIVESGIKY